MSSSPLHDEECQVWWARPDQVDEQRMLAVVSEAERARAQRYHRPVDRLRSLTGCWLLRTVLAANLGVDARQVVLDRTCSDCGLQHGRPRLLSGMGVHLSVSHAGQRVAVAITRLGEVGVDVEHLRTDGPPFDEELAENTLSAQELKALLAAAPEDRHTDFLRLWVRKEALLKATGHGLRLPIDQVEVSPADQEPALLRWPLPRPPEQVRMAALDAGSEHLAAVAVLTGSPLTVRELGASTLL
ncbi:4'-phosphopantetheinyl transferase [Kutzneria viridogrisea]|uniref:4'-phosphopantetheinyl transferase n=1 Tax=Kutzneria viridogrisea TaxID=47990 RepID=A0ABR6BYH9_9PSEU|nr:4'-phosphopantetheinyl transferase superfamily protein [Kutzneria albida]MBA8931969.1 4'-phosphopantetheinyl transferase [Kutzneria viridogrisea]